MSGRRIVIGLVVIAILAAGGYWGYQNYLAPQPEETEDTVAEVNTIAVNTGVSVVSAEGQILPLRDAALSFQTAGVVAEVLVVEGQSVGEGDPLIRLDATDLEISVKQAEAGLAQAEANVVAAEAGLAVAQESVATAEVGVTAAQAQVSLVQADPLPQEIAAAESSITTAEAGIDQASANRAVTVEIPDSSIRAAEAQVAAAMAEQRVIQDNYDNLIKYGVGGTPEEQTRFALNASVASVNAAQASLDELNAGATSAQWWAANSSVSVATAQRDSATVQLDLLLAGAKPEQVTVSEVGVSQAEAAVAQAEVAIQQAETAVTQAEAGVLQAQATLEAAESTLDKMVLTAPFDGAIANVSVEEGEVVSPGLPIVTLADFSEWSVETTDLTELDVVAVAIGYPVDVRVDAIPGEVLKGTVTDIDTVSTLTRGDVTYAVTIRLDDGGDLPLRWGMTVFVDVDTE